MTTHYDFILAAWGAGAIIMIAMMVWIGLEHAHLRARLKSMQQDRSQQQNKPEKQAIAEQKER